MFFFFSVRKRNFSGCFSRQERFAVTRWPDLGLVSVRLLAVTLLPLCTEPPLHVQKPFSFSLLSSNISLSTSLFELAVPSRLVHTRKITFYHFPFSLFYYYYFNVLPLFSLLFSSSSILFIPILIFIIIIIILFYVIFNNSRSL